MNTQIQHIDIIYFTLFPWDNPYSSVSLSFSRELAKTHRIFYINPPFTLKDIIKGYNDKAIKKRFKNQIFRQVAYEATPHLDKNIIAIQPPYILPINWLSEGKTYQYFQKWNDEVIYKTIEKVIRDYKLNDYIYLNCFNPAVAGVLPRPRFSPLLNIYQCIDDMMQESYTAKHWARIEQQVIQNADIATVTSRQLHELKSRLNPKTYIVHNAVDDSIFKKALTIKYEKPIELQSINTPIIGFTGNMDGSRIDYDLLKSIALFHEDKTLVLIGPTNSDHYKKVGLHELKNVIFTGSKNINDLPQYLQYFDCAIIPFLCNTLTASIYPLKINEYLFSGKSVVATNFSEDIRSFSKVIFLANNHQEFNECINIAITSNDEAQMQARIAVAQKNTWTHRVKELWEIMEKYIN